LKKCGISGKWAVVYLGSGTEKGIIECTTTDEIPKFYE
jgi:hypothetical protein